jgi:hypothetical protein
VAQDPAKGLNPAKGPSVHEDHDAHTMSTLSTLSTHESSYYISKLLPVL